MKVHRRNLLARFFVCLAVFFCTAAASASGYLGTDQIKLLVNNRTFIAQTARDKEPWRAFFSRDGSVSYLYSNNSTSRGTWSIDQDRLYIKFTGAPQCKRIYIDEMNKLNWKNCDDDITTSYIVNVVTGNARTQPAIDLLGKQGDAVVLSVVRQFLGGLLQRVPAGGAAESVPGNICGNVICAPGSKCGSWNNCISSNSVDCGNGSACGSGLKCTSTMNECVPEASIQCGDHYCNPGTFCGSGYVCMDASFVDCGNGFSCPRSKRCGRIDGHCIEQNETDCGAYTCSVGMLCASGNKCIDQNANNSQDISCAGGDCSRKPVEASLLSTMLPENNWAALGLGTMLAMTISYVIGRFLPRFFPDGFNRMQEKLIISALNTMITSPILLYIGVTKDATIFTYPLFAGMFGISFVFTPTEFHLES